MSMKSILVAFLVVLGAQFAIANNAYAWKPKPPWCYVNCALPYAKITAHPRVVVVPAGTPVGTTTLRWEWDFLGEGGASFPLACVYVRVNENMHASKVHCEWPGNSHRTTIPWIIPGNVYTFIVSADVGNTVHVDQMAALLGRSVVDVVGVQN